MESRLLFVLVIRDALRRPDLGGTVDKRNRSWLALVAFCATTALVASLALGLLFASATVAFAVGQTFRSAAAPNQAGSQPTAPSSATSAAQPAKFAGVVTDSRCGARHPMNSGRTPAECTRLCLRKGATYVLVDGDKMYTLDGNKDQLARVAGERVEVEGVLDGSTLRVNGLMAQNSPAATAGKNSLR